MAMGAIGVLSGHPEFSLDLEQQEHDVKRTA